MALVTDPICGMRIDTDDAPATAEHEGEIYSLCLRACHDAFVADPASLSILLDRLTEDELAERSRIGSERVRKSASASSSRSAARSLGGT